MPNPHKDNNQFEDLELEEYEFDILWDEARKVWVAKLILGTYLINVKAKGYKELNEYVEVAIG